MIARLKLSTPPPSVNAMWRSVNGRAILSAEGRAWKAGAIAELRPQLGIRGQGFWKCSILIPGNYPGKGMGPDIDNYLKGVLDALGEAKKTPDDRYLVDLRIRFYEGSDIKIAVRREELKLWATIRNISKSTMRKLARTSA